MNFYQNSPKIKLFFLTIKHLRALGAPLQDLLASGGKGFCPQTSSLWQ